MALIKCSECGQMVSDKAARCPKCGCPTKEATVPHQEDVVSDDIPMYDGDENHTKKWLYGIIALLLAAIAGGGYWWYCQSKGNQKVQQFVEQFLKAVETGDRATIRNLYPYADSADSLTAPQSDFMASKIEGTDHYKVVWNKDVWLEIAPWDKEGWTIISSQGFFAWPDNVMDFAKKTGQWKAGLTDKELAERMSDDKFKKTLMDEFCTAFKKKVIQKGYLMVLEPALFPLDPWTLGIPIVNNNDVQISGNDYKVTMRVWNQYFYNNNFDENEAWTTKTVRGKDIAPMGETYLSHTFEGAYESVKESNVKIQWNITNQQLFNKYFVAKGDEYDKYLGPIIDDIDN